MKLVYSTLILLVGCFITSCGITEDPSDVQTAIDENSMTVDTVIVFDPETGKTATHYVERRGEESHSEIIDEGKQFSNAVSVDTIITFDPETYEETIMVVRGDGTKEVISN